ncbi:MAG: response regulator transcription factor [Pseudomonadota bacterium]|nr:response regulator transcription factor [Pseudomonadota bacterium]
MPIKIVLADDHSIIRQGLAPLFGAEHDMELVAQADNGREAFVLIESRRPDVAILDISMPEMTGIEVTRKVVDAGFSTQVILLTMHEDPSAVLEALEAGAAGYVLKDNSFEELVQAVQAVVAGATFVTPSVREKLRKLQRQGKTAASLSKREREVIKLIAQGRSSKEIGRIMDISPRTVDTYRKRLMDKLDLHTLADVVRYAVRTGMVS